MIENNVSILIMHLFKRSQMLKLDFNSIEED
jgi:hypothetical protein